MAPQRSARPEEPATDPSQTSRRGRDDAPAGPAGDAAGEAAGLFAAAGPFAQYPGAVLLAGPGGRVLGATGAAEALAREIAAGRAPDLDGAVAAALGGKAAQINPFFLPASGPGGPSGSDDPGAPGAPGDGSGLAYDLIALPWLSGDAALVIARDITLERGLRAALIDSRQRYKDLAEASGDFAWETDPEGRFTFVSPRGAAGYAAGQMIGQRAEDFLLLDGAGDASPFAARAPVERAEVWLRADDDGPVCLSTAALPLFAADGRWCGARGLCREVTHEHERAAELTRARHREALLGYILRIVRDELDPAAMLKAAAGALVPALSVRGVAIFRRQSAEQLIRVARSGRLPASQTLRPLLARILAGEDEVAVAVDQGRLLIKATRHERQTNGALCLWRGDDGPRDVGPRDVDLGDDEENKPLLAEVAAQVGVANARLARERHLGQGATTDSLTGLLNRRGFVDALASRFARAADRDQPAALVSIGVANIEAVNDLKGAEAGDRVLADLAVLLKRQIRTLDLAARFGGDEFALFLAGIDADAAGRKAAALLAAAGSLGRHSPAGAAALGLSIGVALHDPAAPGTVDALIARAEGARALAREAGPNGFAFSEPPAA